MDKTKQRKYLKRIIIGGVAVYVIVFLLHFVYSIYDYTSYLKEQRENGAYTYTQSYSGNTYINNEQFTPEIYAESDMLRSSMPSAKQNIASGKTVQTVVTSAGGVKSVSVDQKYEKTASIASESTKFEEEQARIKGIIKQFKAVVQTENRNGLEGSQLLYLEIGVSPENFDKLVEELRTVGDLKSFNVSQVDKTEEYLQKKAERETLEATKESYIAIKDMAKTVEERINLEEKIISIDREIRNIDVNLGMFSDEYSFCTVKIELREVVEVEVDNTYAIDIFYIATLAFESLKFALYVCGVILVIACAILVGVMVFILAFTYITNWFGIRKTELDSNIEKQTEKIDVPEKTDLAE